MPKNRIMREDFRQKSYHRMKEEGETPELFSYFVRYRTLPKEERSDLAALAELWEEEVEDVYQVSRTFEWVSRARDFDAETDKQLHYRRLRSIRKLEEKQAYFGQLAQKFGSEQLQKLMARAASQEDPAISTGMAMGLMDFGLRHERTAYGEPSEITEQRGVVQEKEQEDDIDLSRLTPEELREILRIKRKARGLE